MTTVLLFGLACFYLWFLLARAGITEPVFGGLRLRDDRWGELVTCAYCSGFWITGLALAVTGNYDVLTHLATATVVGVLASLTA